MIMKSIRDGFGEALAKLGEKNKDVVVLTADLAGSTRVKAFADKFPDRFFQVGVAEQALVTIAAGMAEAGKIPFTTSYAVFSPGRTWEQIKVTAALNNVPVKIVGAHVGFGAAMYGATHESLEDIALMRVIPGMVVVSPCDYNEAKKATFAIAENGKPTYLRLSRQDSPVLTKPEDKFEIGKANVLSETKNAQVAIVGTGPILYEALEAGKELGKNGIGVAIINLQTIKPIDLQTIVHYAKITGALVTVEEHQITGGLGGAVAEALARNFPVPMEFIGMPDRFGESGQPGELLEKYHMRVKDIVEAAKKVIVRKSV